VLVAPLVVLLLPLLFYLVVGFILGSPVWALLSWLYHARLNHLHQAAAALEAEHAARYGSLPPGEVP
jgi:hypothetical protein